MPRIHVTPEHHDLIFQIGAGNLSDRVVAHGIGVLPRDRQIDVHLHGLAGLQHAHDAVVMLDCDDELRRHFRRSLVVWRYAASEWVGWRWCVRIAWWLR